MYGMFLFAVVKIRPNETFRKFHFAHLQSKKLIYYIEKSRNVLRYLNWHVINAGEL